MPDTSIYSHLHKISALLESYFILKILLAFVLGALIGWERKKYGKMAGFRTFGFICAASCAVSITSLMLQDADPTRMISYIAVGIGFIGGAIIYFTGDQDPTPIGITTASALWVVSGIGILVALQLYLLAAAATLITVIVFKLPAFPIWLHVSKKKSRRV
jgi:putative Mg2+ transporter-C (MgtC) family protein